MKAAIDHLVVAAAELGRGAAWLEERLGVALAPGGRHATMGTHNRLLKLGPRRYLELIAIDPTAPNPPHPRWFGLDDPALRTRIAERPRLLHWVARCEGIEAAAAASPEPLGNTLDLSRGEFAWRITVRADGRTPGDGVIPSLIEWTSRAHPADGLAECGCAVMKLEGFHADPARVRSALSALDLADALAVFPTAVGEPPGLVAFLKTPAGLCEID